MLKSINLKYLYLMINAYLAYIILQTGIGTIETQFVQLNSNSSLLLLLASVLIFSLLQLLFIHYQSLSILEDIFIILTSSILLGLSWSYPIISIQWGYLLILVAVSAYFYQAKHKGYWISLIAGGLIGVRLLYLSFQGESQALDIFQWESKANLLVILMMLAASLLLVWLGQVIKIKAKWLWLIAGLLVGGAYLYLSGIVISRPLTFSSPNYDMGIFSQVFESMRQGRGPMTSLERDQLQSHFAVHISPIFYLILPIYSLWPHPSFLNFIQVIIVASGLIPLYLIVKDLNFSRKLQGIILLIYGTIPTLIASQFFDFHENCCLAPLILWLFYAHLKQHKVWTLIFVISILMVKEDAFIYVLAIGLFALFQDKYPSYSRQFILITHILVPLVYFSGAVYYLNRYGSGAMVGRFRNFMGDDQEGLLQILINAVSNPLYTLHTIFIPRKINYLLLIFSSTGFIALMQKNWSHYFLLLPMLVINLLSNYVYQVDISKQYHFGSTVLVIIMLILALDSIKGYSQSFLHYLLTFAVLTNLFVTGQRLYQRTYHLENWINNYEEDQLTHQVLDAIPRNHRVLAYTFYTPLLADIEHLYDIFYHDDGEVDPEVDYIVFPENLLGQDKKESEVLNKYYQAGYRESALSNQEIIVWEATHLGNNH